MFDFAKRWGIMRIIKQIDSAGFKKWPIGWIKVRRAIKGWKLILGAAVFYSPDILLWAQTNFPSILPAFGVEDSAPALKFVGAFLGVVGLIHKGIKFLDPGSVDRRKDKRTAEVIEKVAVVEEVNKEINKEIENGSIPPGLLTKEDIQREVHHRLQVKKDGLPKP